MAPGKKTAKNEKVDEAKAAQQAAELQAAEEKAKRQEIKETQAAERKKTREVKKAEAERKRKETNAKKREAADKAAAKNKADVEEAASKRAAAEVEKETRLAQKAQDEASARRERRERRDAEEAAAEVGDSEHDTSEKDAVEEERSGRNSNDQHESSAKVAGDPPNAPGVLVTGGIFLDGAWTVRKYSNDFENGKERLKLDRIINEVIAPKRRATRVDVGPIINCVATRPGTEMPPLHGSDAHNTGFTTAQQPRDSLAEARAGKKPAMRTQESIDLGFDQHSGPSDGVADARADRTESGAVSPRSVAHGMTGVSDLMNLSRDDHQSATNTAKETSRKRKSPQPTQTGFPTNLENNGGNAHIPKEPAEDDTGEQSPFKRVRLSTNLPPEEEYVKPPQEPLASVNEGGSVDQPFLQSLISASEHDTNDKTSKGTPGELQPPDHARDSAPVRKSLGQAQLDVPKKQTITIGFSGLSKSRKDKNKERTRKSAPMDTAARSGYRSELADDELEERRRQSGM